MEHVSKEVRRLHSLLWRRRKKIYPLGCHPLDLLKPELAARLLEYDYVEGPIADWPPGRRMKIAGLVDPNTKKVVISDEFDRPTMRFTGAHEVGHIMLHGPKTLLRERPIEGPRLCRQNLEEREADAFGAQFLMPEKLLYAAFEQTIGVEPPIKLDDNLAHWLCPDNPGDMLFAEPGSLLPMRRLARWSPQWGNYLPLNQQFGVSVAAMAIRLQELKFIHR